MFVFTDAHVQNFDRVDIFSEVWSIDRIQSSSVVSIPFDKVLVSEFKYSIYETKNREIEFFDLSLEVSATKDFIDQEAEELINEELTRVNAIINESKMTSEELVLSNIRFAKSVARKYEKYGSTRDELEQESYIGLVEASQKYSSAFCVKFISFAVHYVKMRIRKLLTFENNIVRQPGSFSRKLKNVNNVTEKILNDTGKDATIEEISSMTGYPKKSVKKVLRDKVNNVVSMNSLCVFNDSSEELDHIDSLKSEVKMPHEIVTTLDEIEIINRNITLVLSDMEQLVVRKRFYDENTLEEIGKMIHRSPAGVKAIISRSLLKLKHLVVV